MYKTFFKNKLAILFVLLVIAYIIQSVITPTDVSTLAKYHITQLHAHILVLAVVIPYIAIWFVALVGYLRLKAYTATIDDAKDGDAFNTISTGLFGLTLWLPLSSILSGITTVIHQSHPDQTANMVRLSNYLNLAVLAVSFWLIYRGSEQLQALIKRISYAFHQKSMTILFIIFAALYVYLAFSDPARQVPTDSVRIATFYMRDALSLFTLVIPRLIMWAFGFWAARNIYIYARHVKGAIYRRALSGLAVGLGFVIVSSILLRYIESLSTQLSRFSIVYLLAIYYGLLIIMAVGYLLIAKGAKSLQKIEEV